MLIYGIANCDTCRKAVKALEAAGKSVELVDIRKTPLSEANLDRFLTRFGDALVNKRSTTWRNLDDKMRELPPKELLQAHPTLMKRPVIESDQLHLGWSKAEQAALIG